MRLKLACLVAVVAGLLIPSAAGATYFHKADAMRVIHRESRAATQRHYVWTTSHLRRVTAHSVDAYITISRRVGDEDTYWLIAHIWQHPDGRITATDPRWGPAPLWTGRLT